MGNITCCQISCDQTVDNISRWLCSKGYIRALKENVRALKREMVDLKALQDVVQNKVTREEEGGYRQKLRAVQVWLERVEKTDTEYNNLISSSAVQLQKLFLCGLCSKNVCSSYKYGKKVSTLLEDVKMLKLEGSFNGVSEPTVRYGDTMLGHSTIGQDRILENAWKRLTEDEVGIMGLHGMGGVGKTTLLKNINNKFIEENNKTTEKASQLRVIWVVVSKSKNISKLQDDIAKALNISEAVWTKKNESEKAIVIGRFLEGKTFVLLLDDIWEEVDLTVIGVPVPTRENKCKVVFTTRLQKVCGSMGATPMQVKCLEEDKAWELFEYWAGLKTLGSDSEIVKLGKKVADKCGGLPLALIITGKTMANITDVHQWERELDVLIRSAAEFSDFKDKVFALLKYSYDSLENEHIRSCFLYCALFPEDSMILKEQLIEYWICEGFLGEIQDIKKSMTDGYKILSTLIRANLLMEKHGTLHVGMHDVLRDMALWIASDLGEHEDNFVVQAKVGLDEVPKLKDWGVVKRMSLMENEIEEITCSYKCPELTTLFLQGNNLKNLPAEFIQSMKNLVVLDLSRNHNFNKLPEQISEWVSLQFINLSSTSIEQLPVGFQELKNLIHLNLCSTSRLCSLSGISKLSNIKILELQESNVHGDNILMELRQLEHLLVLNLTISTELGLDQLSRDKKLAKCINGLHILDFQQVPFNISMLVSMENLRFLVVENSYSSETITKDMKSKESTSPCFSNLYYVEIKKCSSIKDLTWLLFAPNLVYLGIKDLNEVEEIINKEKATNLTGTTTVPFHKLEFLHLENLPKLESIYWSPLLFPVLLTLVAKDCQKLRKFPLNASSAPQLILFQVELSSREWVSDWKPDELSYYDPDELSDLKSNELSDYDPNELTDSKLDEISDSKLEELSDSKLEELSDLKSNELSDDDPNKSSDSKPKELSDSKLEELSDSKLEELSDSKPDELSDTAWDEDDIQLFLKYKLASAKVPNNLEWEDENTKNRFSLLIMTAALGTILSHE